MRSSKENLGKRRVGILMSPEMKAYHDAYFRFLDEIPKTLQRIADMLKEC